MSKCRNSFASFDSLQVSQFRHFKMICETSFDSFAYAILRNPLVSTSNLRSGQDNTYCTSNSLLTNRLPESVRKILEIYGYKKYVAQMHIYWVLKTFPEHSRHYSVTM